MEAQLQEALRTLGKKVRVVVNSHGHHDHAGGNAAFDKDVLIIGHKNCESQYKKFGHQVQTIDRNPTYDFDGHLVFFLPYEGGHSQCDIMTYIPSMNLTFMGDMFFSEAFPLVLLEEGSSVETLLFNMNEIFESLPNGTTVVPGHGKVVDLEYFGGYIALMEQCVDLVRKKMKSNWSLQRIIDSDILKDYDKLSHYLPFITKDTWIEQIYHSYKQ